MCLFVLRGCSALPDSSLEFSLLKPALYLHETLHKERVLLSLASLSACCGGWESVPGRWLCRHHGFCGEAVGLPTISSRGFMVTPCSKYWKILVIADVRRSWSPSAPCHPVASSKLQVCGNKNEETGRCEGLGSKAENVSWRT